MGKEKKKQRKSLIIAMTSHVLLMGLLFFVMAWTAPDPPNPQYGIELEFLGNVAPAHEELRQTSLPTITETSNQEERPSNNEAEQTEEAEVRSLETINDIESPDLSKEVMKQQSSNITETNIKTEVSEQSEENVEPEPVIDERALFKGVSAKKPNNGAASKGASLDFVGWMWDFKPVPDDKSAENGKIIFEVKVDDEGEIIGLKTVEKTISPSLEKVYRNAVMELTFSPTKENRYVADQSTGRITFVIQSK